MTSDRAEVLADSAPPSRTPHTRRKWIWLAVALGIPLAVLIGFMLAWQRYPSDRTPEGAYYRIVKAVNRDKPQEFFAYIETPAQHACFSIGNYRRKALAVIQQSYPEAERQKLLRDYEAFAEASDGAEVFAIYARRRGWLDRLRRDLSGIEQVEKEGERATVQTAQGTRYPFRLRSENGIWGLTLFTAELLAEAEKAARDYKLIQEAAEDYERVGPVEASEDDGELP